MNFKLFFSGKSWITAVFVLIVSATYSGLSIREIGSPFIHVSEDTNGTNGVALQNIVRTGIFPLKAGLFPQWIEDADNPEKQVVKGGFYAHHPVGFFFPTLITYLLFGVSETTTRLGPFLLTLLSIIVFFFALRKIFQKEWVAFLATLVYAVLPGIVYYGKHLDMTPPALALAIISFSLFSLHFFEKKKVYFLLFLASVFLGGLVGWHYFLILPPLYLLLFLKPVKDIPHRRLYFYLMPLLALGSAAFVFFHFFLLNGSGVFSDLSQILSHRSELQNLSGWFARILLMGKLNFTFLFPLFALPGALLFFVRRKLFPETVILIPLFFAPALVFLFFMQWSTHPFGVLFLAPAIAVLSAITFEFVIDRFKELGVVAVCLALSAGFFFSWKAQTYFYRSFLILMPADIQLLKDLKPQVDHNQLCLGREQIGIGFGGIVEWYLQKKIASPSECDSPQTLGVIVFDPKLGSFYQQEAKIYEDAGMTLLGCAGTWCLFSR